MDVQIYPPEEVIEASIQLPLSKSISNRALIMNALSPCVSDWQLEVADCDDTKAMLTALAEIRQGGHEINVGPAGTAMRFMTAYLAALPGCEVFIDGNARMRHRPISPLVDALRACGADIEYAGEEGYPPLHITGSQLHGAQISMDATVSSQFVSALLMLAPTFSSPLTLKLQGEIASLPYLRMTIGMMQDRGIDVEMDRNIVSVQPGQYQPWDAAVERDWSAASYWYEIAALSAGWITLPGLQQHSLQGDAAIAPLFERLGVITDFEGDSANLQPSPEVFSRFEADLSDNPDVAQTFAVACCMLGVPFRLTGLESLRIKETDRLAALKAELAKLSFDVAIERDSQLLWEGARIPVRGVAPIDTYGDHRMAMAFAPVALYLPGLTIRDAHVVSKSYPGFWDDMRKAGFRACPLTNVKARGCGFLR